LRGRQFLPAEQLTMLWSVLGHLTPTAWMVMSAFIWGGVINIVGLIYWIALGIHFRNERRREALAAAALQQAMMSKVKP
jgi:hypothetical protein